MKDKKFEDILRDRFAEASSQPSEDLKQRILLKQKYGKQRKLYELIAIAASLSIIIVSLLFIFKNNDAQVPAIEANDLRNSDTTDTLSNEAAKMPIAEQKPQLKEKNKLQNINENAPEWVVIDAGATVKEVAMPDGSMVHLNKNSQLQYLKGFKKERLVKLSGEAYFDVVKNKAPFIITTTSFEVTVVGTSFNVIDNPEKAAVYTVSGVVKVEHGEKEVTLKAEEFCTLKNNLLEKISGFDKNKLAWKTRVLAFDQTPLNEVLHSLQVLHGITFEKEEYQNCKFTGTFNDKTLEQSITMLEMVTGLAFEKNNGGYQVKGNCR